MRPWTHSCARPSIAERASVLDQISHVQSTGFKGTLHICHISTKAALEAVSEAKRGGMSITCGATAHHALLDQSSAGQHWNLLKMNPPLRSASDRDAIYSGLLDGTVDWIESDHAPHTLHDKMQQASGIPGFAGTLLLIKALRKSKIAAPQLASLCAEKAREVFHFDMPIGRILDDDEIDAMLPTVRSAYPWDPFEFVR